MRQIDVAVIGGGPGGSTVATMLARKGWRVAIFERERFPREHIGESLLPASMPVLEELGVLPAIEEAGFLHKWGATMIWGASPEPWSWYFRETNRDYPHTYQVWRARFDQILLDNARAHGVDVHEEHRVLEVTFDDGRATGLSFVNEATGETGAVSARFVVDASGQTGLLGRALKLRRTDDYFRNLAVYAYFDGGERLPAPDENNLLIEAYPNGWVWVIPLHNGWASVGAVVDSAFGQQEIARLGLEPFLREQFAQAPRTAAMLRDTTVASGPHVIRDWSYASRQLVGDGYILVGDAGCFIDPLFSSGVHLALLSGVLASAYITTALRHPEMQEPAAKVYEQLYLKQYSHFREMARLFYSSNRTTESYFWEIRRMLEAEDDLTPREAFVRAVAGQPPQGYERAVLDHGEAPAEFVEAVRLAEEDRLRRRQRLDALLPPSQPPAPAFFDAIPHLAAGAVLEERPVIGEGEFVMSHVLTTTAHPEGAPLSPFVARVVALIDGRRTVAALLAALAEGLPPESAAKAVPHAVSAIRILYSDGAIAELAGR
ncbi:MAG: tryptophan 7-halogenase [Chloroflexi bacterium]|nr:tryptophan 7-halogenase [Chloroflexota bacterium]